MNRGSDPEALVRAMAEQAIPSEPREVLASRRERTVEALGRAIRQSSVARERRMRLQRRLSALGAAAAIALGGLGVYRVVRSDAAAAPVETHVSVATVESVSGTLVVTHAGRARVVAAGERPKLVAGDELRTATDGGAKFRTERSAIAVSPATALTVLAPSLAEERIRVALGRVDLHVDKHTKTPRSVVVETPNAEVIVRGTVFSVAVADEGGKTHTRVDVTEGSVWVLSAGTREIVSAGEDWSSLGTRKAAAEATPPQPTAPEPPRREAGRSSGRVAAGASPATRAGTLGEENRMFQAALDARNRGEDRRAIELFGTLLGRFPKSRLAEEARVERMRALRRVGDGARASAEARRYLSDYGSGFAREEAREAALGAK